MFEYDASVSMRLEIIEAAISSLYETVPNGPAARAKILEIIEDKIRHVGFAHERRHQLEHILKHVQENEHLFAPGYHEPESKED